jgi:lambda family phage portal protein
MVLRSIAAGLDISYTSLTGDLSQANYSSARVGLLDERDGWETLQVWFAEHLHRSVYRSWLSMAVLTPELSLPSLDARRWAAVRFQGRKWAWIDPSKEIQAIKEEIGIGLNSRQNAGRGIGRDFEDIAAELSHENEVAKTLEIDISGAAVTVKEATPGNDAENETTPPAKSDSAPRALHRVPA